jgi:hypothetical protein
MLRVVPPHQQQQVHAQQSGEPKPFPENHIRAADGLRDNDLDGAGIDLARQRIRSQQGRHRNPQEGDRIKAGQEYSTGFLGVDDVLNPLACTSRYHANAARVDHVESNAENDQEAQAEHQPG